MGSEQKTDVVDDTLRSSPNHEADPVDQLAFELAWELEQADLKPGDFVTINREKLKAIARRVLERPRSLGTADLVQATLPVQAAMGSAVTQAWMTIETATRDCGNEIIVRLKQSVSKVRTKALGRSIHQIANWDAEGQLWWDGAVLPDEYVEGFIPLPPAPGSGDRAILSASPQPPLGAGEPLGAKQQAAPSEASKLREALRECEEYFDERADADQPAGCDSPIPNDEMRMLVKVRAALSSTGGEDA